MTDKVLIVISCGTDNPNRSTRAFHLATIAQKQEICDGDQPLKQG